MNHQEQLRAAMRAHEHLAPEPTEVYARVQELARTYKRRRLIAQSAGGAVLGVAAVVGAFQIPNFLPGETAPSGGVAIVQPAAPQPSSAPPSEPTAQDKAMDKYFDSGYSLTEAEKLSELWKIRDLTEVKVMAGQKLLAGEKLPVQPPEQAVEDAEQAAQAKAFWDKGYDFQDAQKLAELWRTPTVFDAKVEAGKRIMAGETLPIRP